MYKLFLMLGSLGINMVAGSSFGATAEADALVDRLIARSQAFQTATFRFMMTRRTEPAPPGIKIPAIRVIETEDGTSYRKAEYGAPAPDIPAAAGHARVIAEPDGAGEGADMNANVVRVQTMILTIAGPEWLLRWPNYAGVQMSRGEYYATYTENVNPDSSLNRALLLELPQGTLREYFWRDPWRRVVRCGSVPFPEMLDYISAHRDKAEYVGKESRGGVNMEILQWIVDQDSYDSVFHFTLPYLYEGRTARLRIFVARELGYAIPRVEFASDNGNVKFWIEASDFRLVGDSIFFPFNWKMINEAEGGRVLLEFEMLSVDNVNEAIPDATFELFVPKGTRVRNGLPGQEAVFRIGEDVKMDKIDLVLNAARLRSGGSPSGRPWGRGRMLLVANSILALAVLAVWFSVRRVMSRKR